jgi:predicted transcriptional regulator
MGEKPDGYELDRINNSEGYYPDNCRYVTRAENQKNKTNSKNVTHNGKSQSVKEWAVEIGIDYQTLMYRIKRGWPMQRAMSPSKMYSRSDFQRRQA